MASKTVFFHGSADFLLDKIARWKKTLKYHDQVIQSALFIP